LRADVVIVVDVSGSMHEELPAIRSALTRWLADLPQDWLVALVLLPAPPHDLPAVALDFGGAHVAASVISGLQDGGGSIEATYDALYYVAVSAFSVGERPWPRWRPGAERWVILVSDEAAQTLGAVHESLVAVEVRRAGLGVVLFVVEGYETWDEIVPAARTGTIAVGVLHDAGRMLRVLVEAVAGAPCP